MDADSIIGYSPSYVEHYRLNIQGKYGADGGSGCCLRTALPMACEGPGRGSGKGAASRGEHGRMSPASSFHGIPFDYVESGASGGNTRTRSRAKGGDNTNSRLGKIRPAPFDLGVTLNSFIQKLTANS